MIAPDDDANRALVAQVHPPDWRNPEPRERYDMVVLGAGTAGLVTAAAAAGLGARVALIERHLMGGDCLNAGCVPSKALLAAAREASRQRHGEAFGVRAGPVELDGAAALARMRRVRAAIAPVDGAARFSGLGVDVFFGHGRFVSKRAVEVEGARLRFSRAVIATGSRPAVPPIPGLAEAGYLTSDTVFELSELPARAVVLGGGAIGCELAQVLARFGAAVTIVEAGERILGGDEPDAAEVIRAALAADGVELVCGDAVARVEADRTLVTASGRRIAADAIVVATGRRAGLDELGLEAAGVSVDDGGVRVDARLRTSNRRIYAAGDVCGRWQFTHAADAMARLVVKNALFHGRARADRLVVPRVLYTEPELAQVGLTRAEAAARNIAVDCFDKRFAEVDRALLDGDADGFARVLVRRGTGEIVGATVVGAQAGELIAPLVLAMTRRQGLGALAELVLPYPTRALALKALGDAYQRSRLTPRIARLLAWIARRHR